ncbi:hypothetical protein BJV78DRAFT_1200969 [Lactifluus subvellereus]|nr:hypothetical protein BJV78DRAFT_1200969 [Lactifluus subvellereus]
MGWPRAPIQMPASKSAWDTALHTSCRQVCSGRKLSSQYSRSIVIGVAPCGGNAPGL